MTFIGCSKISMARMQRFLFQFLNILSAISIVHCQSGDSMTANSSLSNGENLTSSRGIFQLGFFTPISGSAKGYIAIWYYNSSLTERQVVWIANRNQSINTSTATLSFTSEGNLILFDNGTDVSWSTGTSTARNSAQVRLLDSGNLVLTVAGDGSGGSKETLWQSFDHPSDTLLPGMRLGVDYLTNTSTQLVSWKSVTDPSPGNYAFKMETRGVPEIFLWNGSSKIYRTGPWNAQGFSGNPRMENSAISRQLDFNFVSNSDMVYYSTEYKVGSSALSRAVMSTAGEYERWNWESGRWLHFWNVPEDDCDVYASCGRNNICSEGYYSIYCNCLEGFAPAPKNGSRGCDRKKPLSCASNRVVKVANAKLPDTENATIRGPMSLDACNDVCTNDCSCVAYALVGENGCVTWEGDLVDLRNFTEGGDDLYIRLAGSSRRSELVWAIGVPVSLAFLLLCSLSVFVWRRNRARKQDCSETGSESSSVKDDTSLLMCLSKGDKGDFCSHSTMDFDAPGARSRSINSETYVPFNEGRVDVLVALPSYDLSTIKAATNDFSVDNKLGEGGFGVVYMGQLQDGQKIAVKKLSRHSSQGPSEFQNELSLIAKLQHRNLLRVLGSCIQGDERLIILEYMENKSLDGFIYDKTKGALLSWQKRLEIINGIARGLLYLHQDSILRVIHRDLKPSNILLDKNMTPKISDFGIARIFEGDGAPMNATTRPVGTFGYMAPEYLADGLFSFKSDVFSFGVLVLEILSGKRNKVLNQTDMSSNLLVQAYTLWKEGRSLELLDDALDSSYPAVEILRCIRMALLCVQENSEDRPTMTEVVMMLASEDQLLTPLKQPLIRSIACERGFTTKEMSFTMTGR